MKMSLALKLIAVTIIVTYLESQVVNLAFHMFNYASFPGEDGLAILLFALSIILWISVLCWSYRKLTQKAQATPVQESTKA